MNPTDILSLPTDSLYKFMAMSGMALLFISATFHFYVRKQLVFDLYDLEKDLQISALKRKNSSEEMELLKISLDATEGRTVNKSEDDETKKIATRILIEQAELMYVLEEIDCKTKKSTTTNA